MIFIPYRFSLDLVTLPLVTILVSALCLLVYASQHLNERRYVQSAETFCESGRSNLDLMMYAKATGEPPSRACFAFVTGAAAAQDRTDYIETLAATSPQMAGLSLAESRRHMAAFLQDEFQRFSWVAPKLATRELWYHPKTWSLRGMATSVFAHGGWEHVIGNLFFFFAFAAAVEAILGTFLYVLVFFVLTVGTNAAYSLAMLHAVDPAPTVGLSGVVMGMMALLTYLMPHGRIKCFYWIVVKFGIVAIPAWLLFVWYAGFDVYQLMSNASLGEINLVAHVSGATIGYVLGLLFFRQYRRDLYGPAA